MAPLHVKKEEKKNPKNKPPTLKMKVIHLYYSPWYCFSTFWNTSSTHNFGCGELLSVTYWWKPNSGIEISFAKILCNNTLPQDSNNKVMFGRSPCTVTVVVFFFQNFQELPDTKELQMNSNSYNPHSIITLIKWLKSENLNIKRCQLAATCKGQTQWKILEENNFLREILWIMVKYIFAKKLFLKSFQCLLPLWSGCWQPSTWPAQLGLIKQILHNPSNSVR